MTEKEIKVLYEQIEKDSKLISSDPEEYKKFWEKVGVNTKNGNLTAGYKRLICTPQEQA